MLTHYRNFHAALFTDRENHERHQAVIVFTDTYIYMIGEQKTINCNFLCVSRYVYFEIKRVVKTKKMNSCLSSFYFIFTLEIEF